MKFKKIKWKIKLKKTLKFQELEKYIYYKALNNKFYKTTKNLVLWLLIQISVFEIWKVYKEAWNKKSGYYDYNNNIFFTIFTFW